jgi:SAM-dependent methyltransferase
MGRYIVSRAALRWRIKLSPAMSGELKKLADLAASFLREPRQSFRALAQLPWMVRGSGFARAARAPQGAACPGAAPAPTNRLRQFFDARQSGRGIWKWLHYFDIYERHFAKFAGRDVGVLEIGVYSGGSLEMWREYFGARCRVYGVDLQEACRAYENAYTKIYIGDQADRDFWRRFRDAEPALDVLIDDGGHRVAQQAVTLEEMLPHLRPGGVYLCEDVHGENQSFAAYMHGLSRHLNAMPPGGQPTPLQQLIKSVHFYPYVTVIERAELPVAKLEAPKRGTEWQPY